MGKKKKTLSQRQMTLPLFCLDPEVELPQEVINTSVVTVLSGLMV